MIKYFKSLLDCLWEIEKDLHTIASSMKANEKFIPTDSMGNIYDSKEKSIKNPY